MHLGYWVVERGWLELEALERFVESEKMVLLRYLVVDTDYLAGEMFQKIVVV
jgi:hypothetical protein